MKRWTATTLLICALTHLPTGQTEATDFFSRIYFDTLLCGVAAVESHLTAMSEVANDIADQLVADGYLYIAAARPDFVSEGIYRAGGLMMLKPFTPAVKLTPKDVASAHLEKVYIG